ncbi:DNA/RNA non-specific endonuclease [Okeania sp. KiyG1]|uniref:DNA/RNA non-specific endonuclease n=1 Tax=Okeania sp. KiyG1 TaxID=2720165 RepID=UPI001921E997|nr:DNA/RNA non-specific endonuclease [Okeania sp. KiyG1]GGA44410.1 hypothetical protein CYANOKiyG1_63160 [Okeania sp. KiyG1]
MTIVDRNVPNYHNYANKLDKNFLKITKDSFVIPKWGALNFNLHVPPGTNDANLKGSVKVTIQSEDIPDHTFTVNLSRAEGKTGTYESDTHRLDYATVGFETFTTNIPEAFRGQVATVTFELENPNDETTVYVDDIKAKSVHLKFGNNPKGEAKEEARYEDKPYSDNKFAENLLVERPQYTLSYNGTTKTANWASWQMNKSWNFAVPKVGGIQRSDGYQDNTLPQGFTSGVAPSIYKNAQVDGVKYDLGHLTPHRERQRTQKDATAVGLLSNIVPQQSFNNQREWARIENYTKRLVDEGKEVYIIAGTHEIKKDGEGNNLKLPETNGVVDIPANLWKVMLVLDSPGQGVADVTTNNYAVGFYLENRQYTQPNKGQKVKLNDHVKTVNEIEALTGYDFFSNIPSDIQEKIEDKIVKFDDKNKPIEIIG